MFPQSLKSLGDQGEGRERGEGGKGEKKYQSMSTVSKGEEVGKDSYGSIPWLLLRVLKGKRKRIIIIVIIIY